MKRDLKGGALRFESTAADGDAKGRFLRSPTIASPPPCCPALAAQLRRLLPPVTWLCAGALCAMPAQATVKVAGSAWLRVQPASAVTTIPSSSAPLPERPLAHALTLACTHIHHQLSPPVLTTRDQVIFSDLLNAFASTHLVECLKSSRQGTDL